MFLNLLIKAAALRPSVPGSLSSPYFPLLNKESYWLAAGSLAQILLLQQPLRHLPHSTAALPLCPGGDPVTWHEESRLPGPKVPLQNRFLPSMLKNSFGIKSTAFLPLYISTALGNYLFFLPCAAGKPCAQHHKREADPQSHHQGFPPGAESPEPGLQHMQQQ